MKIGTPVYSVIFLLILGAAVVLMPAGAETVTGSAKFDPDRINLALPAPSVVKGTIRFPSNASYTVKDINASTILLADPLAPTNTYFIKGGLVAEFNGGMVVNIIWGKIYHMGVLPPNRKVWLTITGKLNSTAPSPYGGASFSVQGYIKVWLPYNPEPP